MRCSCVLRARPSIVAGLLHFTGIFAVLSADTLTGQAGRVDLGFAEP